MVNILHKSHTLRRATAEATVKVGNSSTIDAIQSRRVPKGDVLEMAKTAGLFAVKRTSDVIPDCHPLPVEYTAFHFEIRGLEIHIRVDVATIYKTGVEVEAMHAVSIAALTMYDMLKPIEKSIEISHIRLVEKTGGKSSFQKPLIKEISAVVVVCSNAITSGKKEDTAGRAVKQKIETLGATIKAYEVIPDDMNQLRTLVEKYSNEGIEIILVVGGTGLTPTDRTPETLTLLFDREVPGIAETMRSYGQQRTPHAMFSRSVAGMLNKSLIIGLPGSTQGAAESIDAIFPAVMHIFNRL